MSSFEPFPQARVVRKGGQLVTPPPEPSRLGEHLRTALAYAIGLWPLTGVVLLAIGLIYMAGMWGSP